MIKQFKTKWLTAVVVALLGFSSCGDDEAPLPAIASFQFEVDANDFRKVAFLNFSQHAVSYSWDFGDGSAATSDENPIHSFPGEGTYLVRLTATGGAGDQSVKEEEILIVDPDKELKKLTGENSKTWKLIRDVSTGRYPFEVGPSDRSQIWYALGLQEALGLRPCLLNDEYIFKLNGEYEYKTNGDFWAEGGVWSEAIGVGCKESVNSNFVNVDGVNISAWNDGIHEFEYNTQNEQLILKGTGAFVGLPKVTTNEEVKVPQSSVTYKIIKLVEAEVDTLILETNLQAAGGYWRFVLVH
ncbi:MAG TPA: PKD domain-containing protein, partial [Cyclobacteriaceae bacterium]|nr:PKD domain-containing protein [Cyclobacteriaceae bacterium]